MITSVDEIEDLPLNDEEVQINEEEAKVKNII